MRNRFFTFAPLRITTLKEHLWQRFTDEEVNALNESCYGKFALYREIHIVSASVPTNLKNDNIIMGRTFVGTGISFRGRLCIQMSSSLHKCCACWMCIVKQYVSESSQNSFQRGGRGDWWFSFEWKQRRRKGDDMFWPLRLIVEIPVALIKGRIWLAWKHNFFFFLHSPVPTFWVSGGKQKEHILLESDMAC